MFCLHFTHCIQLYGLIIPVYKVYDSKKNKENFLNHLRTQIYTQVHIANVKHKAKNEEEKQEC